MNIYCDNYSVCNGMLLDQGSPQRNAQHARAKGWHLWAGTTITGKKSSVTLCSRCVDSKRRDLSPAPERLPGQLDLFELVVRVGPAPKVPLHQRARQVLADAGTRAKYRLGRV
jgi:hypothetical protein